MGDALLEELYPSLWSYTAAACGNSCDPDDVLQDALLRTLRLHDIDELDHPAAYLRKVVLHLVIAEARRTKSQRLTYGVVIDEVPDGTPTAYPSDLSDLMRLSPPDRALLYLVDVEKLDFSAVAELLGCSSSAARKRASRARSALRHELDGEASQ
jgi:RNA polymerase sigma-70 factor (ECF subfamily)